MNIRYSYLLHLKPTRVPRTSIRFTRTFGLGGSALVLLALLAVSGVLLMLVYQASPEHAYTSVKTLNTQYLFGGLVRNVHYWSGNLLFAVAVLHMLRVFYTSAYHEKRRINWVVGVILLFIIMASNFSGYLLPWDQLAYWAITICTAMLGYFPGIGAGLQDIVRGGTEVGGPTLIMFYAFHISLVPIIFIFLVGFHFWQIRASGGVINSDRLKGKPKEEIEYVNTYPDLLIREAAMSLCIIALVLMLSVFIDAPLEAPANSGISPDPAKAPWYFMAFQELQLHFHPLLSIFVIPILMGAALLLFPYLKYESSIDGSWFVNNRGRRSVLVTTVVTLFLVSALVLMDDFLFRPNAGSPTLVWRGVAPLVFLGFAGYALYVSMLKKYQISKVEFIQVLFTIAFCAYVVLTVIGVYFRGKGMMLIWPWVVS